MESKGALLVDDEAAHRMLARRTLSKIAPELTVHECGSLAETVQLFRSVPVAAIHLELAIIDLNLGDHSGLEIVSLLHSEQRISAAKIIVVSTSLIDSDIQASYRSGIACFIQKTTDTHQFSADLAAAISFVRKP